MEKYRLTPNSNGSLSQTQRPSFQTSTPYISFPPKAHLREPSIASYLRPETPKPPAAPRDLTGRRADETEISIFDAERYFNDGHDPHDGTKNRTIVLDGIAERFDLSTNTRDSSVSSVDGYGRNYRNGSFQTTPTASSEASWNSQSVLLTNPPGSFSVNVRTYPINEQRRESSSSGRRFFRRKCPCSSRKSVDVRESYSEPKTPIRSNPADLTRSLSTNKQSPKTGEEKLSEANQSPIRSNHEPNGCLGTNNKQIREAEKIERISGIDEMRKLKIVAGNWSKDQEVVHCSGRVSLEKLFQPEIGRRIVNSGRPFNEGGGFSFPILSPHDNDPPEEPARHSLEVFRPTEETTALRSAGASTPVGRRSFNSRPADDDAASDTSSDLFEIESFSTQMTYRRHDSEGGFDPKRIAGSSAGILQLRRSLEEASSAATPYIAPSECYPPSEVSVEWSVTTAEGFERGSAANFSSAASDYEELRFIQAEHDRFAAAVAGGSSGKRRGSGLLGCVCEKAVSVGPVPVRSVPEPPRAVTGAFSGEPDRLSGKARFGSGSQIPDRSRVARSNSARMCRPVQTRLHG